MPDAAQPSPATSPEDVVTAVLRALAVNDRPGPDHGVAVLFAFASDRLRSALGDEASFGRALHNTRYRALVDHRRATVERFERRGDAARAEIVALASDGDVARYTATLARAAHGERRGCWLLTGLAREGVDL